MGKWLGIASATGLIVGTVIQIFLKLFFPLQAFVFTQFWHNPHLILLLPPIGALAVGLLLHNRWTKEAHGWGPGMDVTIEEIHGQKLGYSHPLAAPVKFLAQLIGIGMGNSGGLVGASGRIGQGVAHWMGKLLHLKGREKDPSKLDMQSLATMAVAAGLAATIRLPLGAGLFAIEIIYGNRLYQGDVDREDIVYAEWAGVSGAITSIVVFGNQPFFGLVKVNPEFWQYPLFALLGFLAGLVSLAFIKYYRLVLRFFHYPSLPKFIKPFIASIIISLLSFLVLSCTKGMFDTSKEGGLFFSFAPHSAYRKDLSPNKDGANSPEAPNSPLYATPTWLGFGADNVNMAKNAWAVDSNGDGRYDQVSIDINGGRFSIPILWTILILLALTLGKIVANSTYVGSGASGGMVMPSIIIGAGFGGAFALTCVYLGILSPSYVAAYVAVGGVSVLAAVTNAPLACAIFSLELFGIGFLGPAMMATMIAYATTEFETIYEQISA